MKKIPLLVLLLVTFIVPISLSAAELLKIGIVDPQKVFDESDTGKKAKSDLESLFRSKQSLIEDKRKVIEKTKSDLEKQASVLSPEARKAKEEELEKMLREYQRFVQDSETEINKKRGELESAIKKELVEIIEKIGREEGYIIIMDRSIAIYLDKAIDITDTVIRKYNESKAKPKKK